MRTGRPPIVKDKHFILERSRTAKAGCREWTGIIRPDGYGKTASCGKQYLAHRLAFCIWTGMSMESELLVLHKCNNKRCVNIKHLYAGTQYENVQDYIRIGIRPRLGCRRGERNNNHKLTRAQCSKIKTLLAQGESVAALSKRFSVSCRPIYAIKNNQHWSTK